MPSGVPRRPLMLTALLGAATLSSPASAAPPAGDPVVDALTRSAHPVRSTQPYGGLRDLRPFGRAVGDAAVVGVGEASHGAHEFFTLKHRLMRYLVEAKRFGTFALEASWSSGLRLNEYLLHGTGDPGDIMREEFQSNYRIWNIHEYLDLVTWMREHNRRHRSKLRFMGTDVVYPGPGLFDAVIDYLRRRHPAIVDRFEELYHGLRPPPAPAPGSTVTGSGRWPTAWPPPPASSRPTTNWPASYRGRRRPS
ncbi:MAG TPA: erythromycin esterase family protein [Micromonospora sp.]